ncbi:multicopper oxidase family protein [Piscinibacter sp.]|uniref:multicopper oxidase family protein n=1 Tax=Piscinibacter sp. TaxID=1903157 RepID=UPI002C4CDA5D|nr:multicopper oxidase family protein [Albitalea sp.]HUG25386.1 multicopper oxidase family protein [Albitalea sp.]
MFIPASASSIDRRAFLALAGLASTLVLTRPLGAMASARDSTRRFELIARPVQAPLLGHVRPPVAAWGYGAGVPGPEIRLRQGERLRVEVVNRLPQETTVHWHGLRVPNAMDGVPHLTQPPIAPGQRFVYEFDVPDAGTYWYHPHHRSAEQVGRGLYGPLIVEEPEPLAVDRDLTWMLDDWRLTKQGQISETFEHPHDMSHGGQVGNLVTINGVDRSAFALRSGERVRLRLINAANARLFALQFSGHRPTVVALDGQPVTPHEPADGRVVLGPAMRVDLILDAVGKPGQRHTVRDTFYPRLQYDLLELVYEATPLRARPLETPVQLPANPLAEPDLGGAKTHEIRFQGGMMGTLAGATLNGRPMNMRQLMGRGKAWAVNGVVADGHMHEPVLTLERGRSYVIALRNDTRWHHPIHLHGHSFRVIRRNGQPTRHREWQDTVLMAPDEGVDIAFVADNPGDWMLHCHILEHQSGGMMSVIRVA